MTCLACTMTLFIDLHHERTIPVEVEYVQTVSPDRITYDLLDASLSIETLRTLSLHEAETVLQEARAQFTHQLNRGGRR